MTKKSEKVPVSVEIPANEPKVPSVKAVAYEVRDPRGGYGSALEPGMERVWRECKYPDKITIDMYYRMYSRNNVAARVIETFPDYCWAVNPIVTDGNGPESRFSKSVLALLTNMYALQDGVRQSLLTSMKQLDMLGGIGGEALLVFGFNDGGKISEKVKKQKGTEIQWIKILHNGQFEVEKRETDDTAANFGDVVLYKTKDFASQTDLNFYSQIAPGKSIHASRCVHFKESSGLAYGTSRIQKCYNQLLDLTKLSGASAEVYWLGAFSGMSVETAPECQLGEGQYDEMKLEIKKYFDGLARSLILEGSTAKLLYPAIVSPKDHFDLQITMISIATGIPRRFLTGAEAAKLASQQDTLNWDDRVDHRCVNFVGPKVVMPVVQRCIDAGVVPTPKEDKFGVLWPRKQSIALNERADASRNMTAAWEAYFASGMADLIPFRTYLVYACGFSSSEAEDIEMKSKAQNWKKVLKTSESIKNPPAPPATTEKKPAEKTDGGDDTEDRIEALEHAVSELTTTQQYTSRSVAETKLAVAKVKRN